VIIVYFQNRYNISKNSDPKEAGGGRLSHGCLARFLQKGFGSEVKEVR